MRDPLWPLCPQSIPAEFLSPCWGGGCTKQEEQGEQRCGATPEDIKTQCGPAPLSSSQMETFNSQLLTPHPLPPVPPAWIPFSGLAVSSASFASLVSQHLLRKPSPLTPVPQSWPGRTPPAPSAPCLPHPSSDHPRRVVISGWCARLPRCALKPPLLAALPQFPSQAPPISPKRLVSHQPDIAE